jgi:hypothetical protein
MIACSGQATTHAGFDAVGTEVALGRRSALRVQVDGVVGARLHARLAADANARGRSPLSGLCAGTSQPQDRWRRTVGGRSVAARYMEMAARVGNCPSSTHRTHVRKTPRGTWFSALHATEQAWQPMHLRLSITRP